MKAKQSISSFSIFITTIALFLLFHRQVSAKVIINEIAWMGTDESQYGEWIELYNDGDEVDLKNWKILKRKNSTDAPIVTLTKKIPPKSYYLVERTTDTSSDPVPGIDDDTGKWNESGLSNSGEFLSLQDASGTVIDSVDGTDGWKIGGSAKAIGNNTKPKKTAQRIDTSWQTLSPTPKTENTDSSDTEEDIGKETSSIPLSIRINELFPNPSGKDDGNEWVELFNFGTDPIDIKGWTLVENSGAITPLREEKIIGRSFLTIPMPLTNSEETISLLDASKNDISTVSYKNAKEAASYNFFKNNLYRWSKTVTRDSENIFNSAPEMNKTDIPDTAYLDIPVSFSASGSDGDDETIKYTWDFGDGHKSYKQATAHRYEKKGKYQGTLTIGDGTENTVTAFSIEVKQYEAPKVRMLSLVPNPEGKDADTENIEIENRSKKSVDLIGWSIATGWKKLVNHPVRESFVIPGKSKRFLTREFSSFTLPNKKGKIELRSPDGRTVQKLKYDLKGKSAEENARLIKERGKKWEWISNQKVANNKQGTNSGRQMVESRKQEEESQLRQDTEMIALKKKRGEKLVSVEKNPREEMRKLISFGTGIETPVAVLDSTPRVAGARSEVRSPEITPEDFDLNAVINDWLAKE